MRRLGIAVASVLGLAACDPQVPDSAAGVGFGDYNAYAANEARARAERNAQLASSVPIGAPEATGAPSAGASAAPPAVSTADLAAAGIGASAATSATAQSQAVGTPLAATSTGAAYAGGNNVGISDEQDFGAVSSRETIQSDAERLAQQRSGYQATAPSSVPERPKDTGPDIVAYALGTSHQVGQPTYRRTFPSQSKAARKCAAYPSDDMAQFAFLDSGGPEKDRHGIDPDGDGYACKWDPARYRRAVGG